MIESCSGLDRTSRRRRIPPFTISTNWSRRDTAHHATSNANACDFPDCRGAKIAVTSVSNTLAATCTPVICRPQHFAK